MRHVPANPAPRRPRARAERPGTGSAHRDILALQRDAGNGAVAALLRRGPLVVQRTLVGELEGLLEAETLNPDSFLDRVRSAGGPDRVTAADDQELLGLARTKLGDRYGEFVRALHIQAALEATQLSGFPTVQNAAEATKAGIKTLFGSLISARAFGGPAIEERLVILPTGTFVAAGLKYYPKKKAEDFNEISGFNINDKAYIDAGKMTDVGTVIHESIHMFAPNEFGTILGNDLNEGVTEFYARKTISHLTLPIARTKYASQFMYAQAFMEYIGEDVVKEAYFAGATEKLKWAFIAKVRGRSGETVKTATQKWDDFLKAGADKDSLMKFLFSNQLMAGEGVGTITILRSLEAEQGKVARAGSVLKQNTEVEWKEAHTNNVLGESWTKANEVYTGKANHSLPPLFGDLQNRAQAMVDVVEKITALNLSGAGKDDAKAKEQGKKLLRMAAGPVTLEQLTGFLADVPVASAPSTTEESSGDDEGGFGGMFGSDEDEDT